MAEQGTTADLDHELTLWLDTTDDEPREVIVEARVPRRRVRLDTRTTHRTRPHEVITEEGPSRAAVLEELQNFLTEVVGSPPRILWAAGAIPLLATRNQIRQIVRHPKVKAVRVNRRLK
jgi:hypothetical protein